MEKFKSLFGKAHAILPVIHVQNNDQALLNVKVARDCGADGVFLISHGTKMWIDLINLQSFCMDETGWNHIGINCLDMNTSTVANHSLRNALGVWDDNASAFKDAKVMQTLTDADAGLYFGGVAFKYQRPVDDYAEAAKEAESYMDVITTSGDGTGKAASVDKIRIMREATNKPIGIASGITPENISSYLPYANAFLVATGIGKDFYNIDPDKLKELVKNCS